MEATHPRHRLSQSEKRPARHAPLAERRRKSSADFAMGANAHSQEDSQRRLRAFTGLRSFDDLEASTRTPGPVVNDIPFPRSSTTPKSAPGVNVDQTSALNPRAAGSSSTPPHSSTHYMDTSILTLEGPTHRGESPILGRESTSDQAFESFRTENKPYEDDKARAKHSGEPGGISARRLGTDSARIRHQSRDRSLTPLVSNAEKFAICVHPEQLRSKASLVNISKVKERPESTAHRASHEQPSKQPQQDHEGPKNFKIRRKALPVTVDSASKLPLIAPGSAREGSDRPPDLRTLPKKPPSSTSSTLEPQLRSSARSIAPSHQSKTPQPSKQKGEGSNSTTTHPKERSVPPGPSQRPISPPLHRNSADNCRPREQKDRELWTLYNISCWTEKARLKSLLQGPNFEFRVEPHGKPFLVNVSREMLTHFCGKQHVQRVVQDYGIQPEHRKEEDGEEEILVFPESIVDATAIMRIIRYMRRCCMKTTTITKPHFQLHAPPSLEANIETIRACNLFGLYADARRLQYFLTDKKIPGGKLTMEDVETIWEGYDGGLRDSVYTDTLLVNIVYNVLGSDSVDREDILVLLAQEEFAGLRELIGTELGIKKKAAENRDMFKLRKEREREDIVNRANGKNKRTRNMDEIRAIRGPIVQGRLLRILSYDALLQPDLTAETRYKPKPRPARELISTTDLTTGTEEQRSPTTGRTIDRPAAPTPSGRKQDLDMFRDSRAHEREAPGSPSEKVLGNMVRPVNIERPIRADFSGKTRRTGPPRSDFPFQAQSQVSALAPPRQHANINPNAVVVNIGASHSKQVGSHTVESSKLNSVFPREPYSFQSRASPLWANPRIPPQPVKKQEPSKLKQWWEEVWNSV